jgi:hypothetical protein
MVIIKRYVYKISKKLTPIYGSYCFSSLIHSSRGGQIQLKWYKLSSVLFNFFLLLCRISRFLFNFTILDLSLSPSRYSSGSYDWKISLYSSASGNLFLVALKFFMPSKTTFTCVDDQSTVDVELSGDPDHLNVDDLVHVGCWLVWDDVGWDNNVYYNVA